MLGLINQLQKRNRINRKTKQNKKYYNPPRARPTPAHLPFPTCPRPLHHLPRRRGELAVAGSSAGRPPLPCASDAIRTPPPTPWTRPPPNSPPPPLAIVGEKFP